MSHKNENLVSIVLVSVSILLMICIVAAQVQIHEENLTRQTNSTRLR